MAEAVASEAPAAEPWALALFRRSVLKQRKYAEIAAALGPNAEKVTAACENEAADSKVREECRDRGKGDSCRVHDLSFRAEF